MNYYELPEWPAFLAAIRAAPDDDLPRLVAADFVEENGDAERAELIRIDCELASKPDRAACDRCRKEWSRRRFSSYPVDMGWCDNCRTKGPFWPDVERSLALRRRRTELRDRWQRPWTEADERAGLNTYGDRGFVTRVSAPLAVLNGERCRCMEYTRLTGPCDCCHGTGRTPGVLGELLRREPVTAAGIEVTGVEPWDLEGGGSWCWWRGNGMQVQTTSTIPPDLFDAMAGEDIQHGAKVFNSEPAARLALGEALFRLHGPKSEVTT